MDDTKSSAAVTQTWVFAGDSITDAGRNRDNPTDLGQGFVRLIDQSLRARNPRPRVGILNRGISGDTVRDLARRWQRDVVDTSPRWVSVCIGINDAWQWHDGKDLPRELVTLREYERTLKGLVATLPSAREVLLLTPYFLHDPGGPLRRHMDLLAAIVRDLAATCGAVLVDTQRGFDLALLEFRPEQLSADGAHLEPLGTRILAHLVLEAWDAAGGRT